MNKCIHAAKDPNLIHGKITPQSTKISYELCKECLAIYQTNPRANPADSVAYNLYYTLDANLPREQWTKANDTPIYQQTPDGKYQFRVPAAKLIKGADYYSQVVAINALGFEAPSEIIQIQAGDTDLDLPVF